MLPMGVSNERKWTGKKLRRKKVKEREQQVFKSCTYIANAGRLKQLRK